ncbi:FadR/GntR family transcriptional regulator [Sandaracinobacteroides saxicola]|uniref:FadR family transcriptional regulator n=1 Tax=Sandaracinobacteroides saxicola TaxID=2759707 RepID=A0A7G5IM34_9SPHN|nr:FadR/GntR family transcriptional regulator [Sandaracinobacteroides saxicola]QMW24426.1 FadR family transcriptional regulator [Sandaracinobacteroides saxicola]
MNEKAPSGRLYERVAQDLSARILRGEFAVGKRLPSERDLAQTYAVSRPTVREALIALELDGLIEVRVGSGVYVTANQPVGGTAGATDVGPFELLEARRAFESEVCALAAARITPEQIIALELLVDEMRRENERDVVMSEDADRRFHVQIAAATCNSVMVDTVEALWAARARSPQTKLLTLKAQQAGIIPREDEHSAIVDALRRRDPEAARRAMHTHLSRAVDSLLAATEVHEVEQARARVAAERQRYAAL